MDWIFWGIAVFVAAAFGVAMAVAWLGNQELKRERERIRKMEMATCCRVVHVDFRRQG